jgi:Uroporphyrinogen-III decarboxylase
MHKDDQMTPLQRLDAFLNGKPMDRILIMPILCSMSGMVAGMTHKEKRSSARNEAMAQVACYREFGNDLAIIEYGLHGVGISQGTQMSDPENSVPTIREYAIENLDQLDRLDLDKLRPENDPKFQRHLEAIKITQEEIGDEVPVGMLISGPFTAAASIFCTENLLRETRKHPEKLHELLRFCTDGLKGVYREIIKTGAMVLFCDPIASGTIIHRRHYLEFVLPYTRELMKEIHDAGGMVCYHICGDTTNIVEDMTTSGCDMISIDNLVSLKSTKEKIGGKLPILGNVDPVEVLILGSREDVDAKVKQCIEDAYDSPCGYMLASGCDLNGDVPLENIHQFMESGRRYGSCAVGRHNLFESQPAVG